MNKVSRPTQIRSKVSFEVTVPGLTKDDFPALDQNNCTKIEDSTACRSYAYKLESSPKKLAAKRFSDEDSSIQYLMFTLYRAAEFHVHTVTIYYDENENSVWFNMDFGTEYEDHAERFFGYLFLNCGH